MHIKPVAGRQVPDPDKGGYLPPEGREVEANQYWLRRVNDGDVSEELPAAPAAPAAEAKSPKAKPESKEQS